MLYFVSGVIQTVTAVYWDSVYIFPDGKGSKRVVGREGNGTSVASTRVVVQTSVQAVFIEGLLIQLAPVTTSIMLSLRMHCQNNES